MIKDDRMRTIYGMVRAGVTVCDVGTDHAHIPIELILSGKAPRCIITDISAPSLEKGIANARIAGCGDKISSYCANGTLGVPLDNDMDVIIAGMGGELISDILRQDKRLRSNAYGFVLQPMSKPEALRSFLAENGFEMIDEVKTEALGRVYAVIKCRYTGKAYKLTEREIYLGCFTRSDAPLEKRYAEKVISSLETRLEGLKRSDTVNEAEISQLEHLISEIK